MFVTAGLRDLGPNVFHLSLTGYTPPTRSNGSVNGINTFLKKRWKDLEVRSQDLFVVFGLNPSTGKLDFVVTVAFGLLMFTLRGEK